MNSSVTIIWEKYNINTATDSFNLKGLVTNGTVELRDLYFAKLDPALRFVNYTFDYINFKNFTILKGRICFETPTMNISKRLSELNSVKVTILDPSKGSFNHSRIAFNI